MKAAFRLQHLFGGGHGELVDGGDNLPIGDRQLIDALPIASAVFARVSRRTALIAGNRRFADALGATGSGEELASAFRDERMEIGALVANFLEDPLRSADELDFQVTAQLVTRHYRLKLSPLARCSISGPRCLASLVDRSAEVLSEQARRAEMLRDSLTGLPNRLGFAELIDAAEPVSPRDGKAVDHAVLVLDIRRFSRVNDSMGVIAGDELLVTLARRVLSTLRLGDVLARTGGNEFGLMVAVRRGVDEAIAVATRIQKLLAEPFRLGELELRIDCAIGIALAGPSKDGAELVRNAQFAVKQAKRTSSPQMFAPADASAARRRFSIETELRRAIERDELFLRFQPVVEFKSGLVRGFESLARWVHPDRGEIMPDEFIPVAEESGLILALGRWAVDRAAHTLKAWDAAARQPLRVRVGVNISAIQVARDNIADVVDSALRSSGLEGSRLTLELTESAIVQNPERANMMFESLRSLGSLVALDDFGTGYSSLAALHRLPIDVLKIDKSFVTGVLQDADSVAIVRAILALGAALDMRTVAEGIESPQLADALAALGCESGQGYHYARPLDADAAFGYFQRCADRSADRLPGVDRAA